MIESKEVSLIPLNEENEKLVLKWVNNPEQRDMTGTRFPVSEYEHRIWYEKCAKDVYNKTYLIRENTNNTKIGLIGNKYTDLINRTSEVFIYIGENECKHKGYGTKAMRLLIDFCFNEMNLYKLNSYLYEYNLSSKKLFLNCGFEIEGVLKKQWFKKGKYHDVLVMGCINES